MKTLSLILLCCSLACEAATFPLTDANGYRVAYSTPIYDSAAGDTCSSTVTNKWFTSVLQTCLQIPKLDTAPTAVDCLGSSGVNPNDGDQYIIRDTGGFGQLNSSSYDVFFVCPGDYSGAADILLTQDGSSGTRRWMIHCDGPGDACDTSSTSHPYTDESDGYEQALMPAIHIKARWWVLSGLKCVAEKRASGGKNYCFQVSGDDVDDARSNVLDRVRADCSGIDGPQEEEPNHRCVSLWDDSGDSTIQFSAVGPCYPDVDVDNYALYLKNDNLNGGRRVIGNELFDCTDNIQQGDGSDDLGGLVVENNDIYFSTYRRVDCDSTGGIQQGESLDDARNVNGNCICAEELVDVKDGGSSDDWDYWMNNRFWGGRAKAWSYKPSSDSLRPECGASGAGGAAASIALNNETRYQHFVGNIMGDSQTGAIFYGIDPDRESTNWEQNIFHGIEKFHDGPDTNGQEYSHGCIAFSVDAKDSFMFNTCQLEAGTWTFDGDADTEVACNIFIGGNGSSGNSITQAKISNNVYVDGADSSEDSNPSPSAGTHSLASMGFETYRYYRKLLDPDGPELITVPNIVPTATNPDNYQEHCSSYTPLTGYGFR